MAPDPRVGTAGADPGRARAPLALEMEPQQTAACDRQCRAESPLPAWSTPGPQAGLAERPGSVLTQAREAPAPRAAG